jgi:hypothetical protein
MSPSWRVKSLRYSRNSPPIVEPEGSLLCLQQPATDPCSEPNDQNIYLPTLFEIILYHLPIHRGLSSGIFPSVFHQTYLKFCFSYTQCSKDETEITTMDMSALSTYSIWDCSCKGYLIIVYQTKRSVSKISWENEGLNYINDKIWSEEHNKKILLWLSHPDESWILNTGKMRSLTTWAICSGLQINVMISLRYRL